jgi:hypothetical protein
MYEGTWQHRWLRHRITSWKVAGSIPDGVTGVFHWHNPSGHTIALGLTQPLTEVSTRNNSWGVKAASVNGWQPYHLDVPIVLKSGSLDLLEPYGPLQAHNGIALPFNKNVWYMQFQNWKISQNCLVPDVFLSTLCLIYLCPPQYQSDLTVQTNFASYCLQIAIFVSFVDNTFYMNSNRHILNSVFKFLHVFLFMFFMFVATYLALAVVYCVKMTSLGCMLCSHIYIGICKLYFFCKSNFNMLVEGAYEMCLSNWTLWESFVLSEPTPGLGILWLASGVWISGEQISEFFMILLGWLHC